MPLSVEVCPYFRFHNSDSLKAEVTRLVRNNPTIVSHIPEAIGYLVTPHSVEVDAPEVILYAKRLN